MEDKQGQNLKARVIGQSLGHKTGQGAGTFGVQQDDVQNDIDNTRVEEMKEGRGNFEVETIAKEEYRESPVGGQGEKVVSLKGIKTQSEIEKSKTEEQLKKKAVVLGRKKTLAEIQREKELEEEKKKAVVLGDLKKDDNVMDGEMGVGKTNMNGSWNKSVEKADVGNTKNSDEKINIPDKSKIVMPEPSMIITPEDVSDVGLKLPKKEEIVDLSGGLHDEEKTTAKEEISNGVKESKLSWNQEKVSVSGLSADDRIKLQATPALASVNLKVEDDTNGELTKWFEDYNRLPVNIKLGLNADEVREAIVDLAKKMNVYTEEGLGEISRIVRDTYVKLIGESEIRKRAVELLGISDEMLEAFVEAVAKIVTLVRDVGNKKSDEYYDKLAIKEVLEKYPEISSQEITRHKIMDKKTGGYLAPTVKNWLDDYIKFVGSGQHDSLDQGRYLTESENVQVLSEEEKDNIAMLIKSYDNGMRLVVDPEEKVIYWRLHTDESELGINSDKNKRVINKFKIEESQKIDVDKISEGNVSSETENEKSGLEKRGNDSIIEDRGKRDVLDLSSELSKK